MSLFATLPIFKRNNFPTCGDLRTGISPDRCPELAQFLHDARHGKIDFHARKDEFKELLCNSSHIIRSKDSFPLRKPVPNQLNFMLVSIPHSGSTWFMDRCCDYKGYNARKGYMKEFFQPEMAAAEFYTALRKVLFPPNFHTLTYAIPEDRLQGVYEDTWVRSNMCVCSGLHMSMQIPFLKKYFDMVVLYRHRKYTLNGILHDNQQASIINGRRRAGNGIHVPWYESLMTEQSAHVDLSGLFRFPALKKLKSILESKKLSDKEKVGVGHTISWYIILKYAKQYNITVIDYGKLLQIESRQRLEEYLQGKLPRWFLRHSPCKNIRNLAGNIIKTRRGAKWLDSRVEKYKESGIEPISTFALKCLQEYDKDVDFETAPFNLLKFEPELSIGEV